MNNSGAKASLFDLYPQDRECLDTIKKRLEIDSNALAVRLAIRNLAERLSRPDQLREPVGGKSAQEEEQHD